MGCNIKTLPGIFELINEYHLQQSFFGKNTFLRTLNNLLSQFIIQTYQITFVLFAKIHL